jgi:pimeloyl-ACP methyl ester carboxylesterase
MTTVSTDDGIKLSYRLDDFTPPWIEDKDKETVFMHHGFARNMKWWTLMVPRLSIKYRVLRLDARGCGESRVRQKGVTWSAERLLKDVVSLLGYLGIEKIHWVGESSGGMVGLLFVANHSDRIKSLTLINTPLKFPDEMARTYAQGYSDPATAIETLGFKEWVAHTMGRRIDRSGMGQVTNWFRLEQSKTPTQVAAAFMRIFQSVDFTDKLSEIKVPTLFLMGERNLNVPSEQLSLMRQQMPDLKIVVFKDAGSGIVLLQPERCTEELLNFLGTAAPRKL